MIGDTHYLESKTAVEPSEVSGTLEFEGQELACHTLASSEVSPRRAAGRALGMVAQILRRPRRRFVRLRIEGTLSWQRENRDLAGALIRLNLR